MEEVVLVDAHDRAVGTMEKMEAHRKGALHRAFSVLLFNKKGELLLQKRAKTKYHSGGLWTNTCCSHPRPGEPVLEAANRKLMQEMGIKANLKTAFSFVYQATFDNGLHEHEFDHVLTDTFEGEPRLNPEEAEDWKWMSLENLEQDMERYPHAYTAWFKILLRQPAFQQFALPASSENIGG
jgi:isopentenyl-diphosphate delta-isomerase